MLGFNMGPGEMLIIGVVALLLFGKRLPEVAKNVGKSLAEFKKSVSGFESEIRSTTRDAERKLEYNEEPTHWQKHGDDDSSDVVEEDEFEAPKFKVQD